ncbi:MAG: hypothetical protein RL033_6427 [Pseudomonadota bacterium]|jgi:hypothetical protein
MVLGVAVFVGVNISTGRAIVPTIASVSRLRLIPAAPPEPPKPPYQAVCSACHQPEGQGIPFAFPPLAGSQWLTGDAETPIRIVLLGMSGPVEVNGATFNLVMPPPPGLDDAKIADAISYARKSFGNSASAVDAELVKKVRESLSARTTPWTASELTALRTGALGGSAAANATATATQRSATTTAKTKTSKAKTPQPERAAH